MNAPAKQGKGPHGPLVRFNDSRDEILSIVESRVLDSFLSRAHMGEEYSLEYVLNDVAYAEMRRFENATSRKGKRSLARWRDLASRLGRMKPDRRRHEVEKLVRFYSRDIVGNFNPNVYRFANGVIPRALSFLLAPVSGIREGLEALGGLESQLQVEGHVELAQKACERGTVIFAPTHSSNLDSIVIGFGLSRSGLPPVTYGAGKNLFSNPLISYFMYNLGAYRVDRRLRFALYKEVLKEYSTVLLEKGFHSLFFPGGTRSRSNMIESRLKLGLLGTGIAAYRNRLLRGEEGGNYYVIPVTINYRLVLEAETLIEDYLAETGRSRYIIEDDEFSQLGRIVEFARKLLVHDSAVTIRMGRPLDLLGHETDDNGNSVDRAGRAVDLRSFFLDASGEPAADPQRDSVYTQQLGASLARSFRRETEFLGSPLVCRAVFDALVKRTGIQDVYRLLRVSSSQASVTTSEVCARIETLCSRIRKNPELGRLSSAFETSTAEEMLSTAISVLGTYHSKPVLVESGTTIRVGYPKLLLYYKNRTSHILPEPGE